MYILYICSPYSNVIKASGLRAWSRILDAQSSVALIITLHSPHDVIHPKHVRRAADYEGRGRGGGGQMMDLRVTHGPREVQRAHDGPESHARTQRGGGRHMMDLSVTLGRREVAGVHDPPESHARSQRGGGGHMMNLRATHGRREVAGWHMMDLRVTYGHRDVRTSEDKLLKFYNFGWRTVLHNFTKFY